MMELVRDGIKIEWADIGEGLSGDFNDEDPNDIPLLRFYVLREEDGEWYEVEDASYCTQMPVATPEETLRKGLEHIYEQVHDAVKSGDSIKKICEDLSWIGPHTCS